MKQNWKLNKLSEVIIDMKDGGTPSRKNASYFGGDINWCVVTDIKPAIYDTKEKLTKEGLSKCSSKLWPINTVIISLGATIGKVGLAKVPVATKQGLSGIVVNAELLLPEYLIYYLNLKKDYIQSLATGTTIKEVRPPKLKENLLIPVAPINEQKNIVEKLDTCMEQIDKAIQNVEKNIQNAKDLFKSQLNEIFSQKGDGWQTKKMQELCEKITDGTHQTPKYFDQGVVFLSSKNVTSGKIDWENVKYIDNEQHIAMHKRIAPKINDILLAKNGTTGVAAMVDRDVVFDIYVSLAHIRVLDEVIPKYMLHYINSPLAKKQFNSRLKGVGVPNLHLKEIREVEVSFPISKLKQESIITQLDGLKRQVDLVKIYYQKEIFALKELKQTILEKAFNGEL